MNPVIWFLTAVLVLMTIVTNVGKKYLTLYLPQGVSGGTWGFIQSLLFQPLTYITLFVGGVAYLISVWMFAVEKVNNVVLAIMLSYVVVVVCNIYINSLLFEKASLASYQWYALTITIVGMLVMFIGTWLFTR